LPNEVERPERWGFGKNRGGLAVVALKKGGRRPADQKGKGIFQKRKDFGGYFHPETRGERDA